MAKPADKRTALWVLRRLRSAGHKALLAGGCVRDMLLGLRSTDYDVATSATPRQVKRLFRHVLLIGAKFGVAMVIHRGRKVEVTTFRSDLSYSDGRRPDAVRFATAEEDARRRDFTINGLFYDPIAEEVIDTVGGQADLRRGLIRTIGNPSERFAEDYLRMLRAVRFAVRLGFKITPATARAIRQHAPKITSISGERIFDELSKMLSLPSAAQALRKMAELGLAKEILPELLQQEELWQVAVERVESLAKKRTFTLTLGATLAELPPRTISTLVRRWGASNDLRAELCFYSQHLDDWRRAADLQLSEFKRLMASRHFANLQVLWRCRERRLTGRQVQSRRIARRAAGIPKARIAPTPLVTGSDLIKMGLKEGARIGRLLKHLYNAQLNEKLRSRREALAMARQLIHGS